MPFKLQDRVRFVGDGSGRTFDDPAFVKRRGALGTVVGGPDALAEDERQTIRYTVRFDNGDRWWVNEDDLEPI